MAQPLLPPVTSGPPFPCSLTLLPLTCTLSPPHAQRGPEQGSCTCCTSAQNAFLPAPSVGLSGALAPSVPLPRMPFYTRPGDSQVHCSLSSDQVPLLRGLPPPLPLLPCSGPGSFTAGVSVHVGLCVGLSSLLERKTPGNTRSDCSPASPWDSSWHMAGAPQLLVPFTVS